MVNTPALLQISPATNPAELVGQSGSLKVPRNTDNTVEAFPIVVVLLPLPVVFAPITIVFVFAKAKALV